MKDKKNEKPLTAERRKIIDLLIGDFEETSGELKIKYQAGDIGLQKIEPPGGTADPDDVGTGGPGPRPDADILNPDQEEPDEDEDEDDFDAAAEQRDVDERDNETPDTEVAGDTAEEA